MNGSRPQTDGSDAARRGVACDARLCRHLTGIVPLLAGLPLLVILPLAGVRLAGKPIGQYTEFPPLTQYVEHAGFSWVAFALLAVLITAVVGAFVWRNVRAVRTRGGGTPAGRANRFPLWGWFGIGFGVAAWILAWTRFSWFARLQDFTFSPLWFAYILVVNALAVRRTGRCLMTDHPVAFGLLFPLSAAFWWFFEFLNRFVQNWHYVGIGTLSSFEYVVFATLPFSTVLPAVLSTERLLRSVPAIGLGLERIGMPSFRAHTRRVIAAATLALAAAGLTAIGVWPDWLFPLLWLSPLLVMTSIQTLAGKPTLFSPLAHGDWSRLYRLALAALVCGFFWEMWNYYSLARWVYAVPFVNRFHVFEMPILGYAGYLPFGLECAVAARIVLPPETDDEPEPRAVNPPAVSL